MWHAYNWIASLVAVTICVIKGQSNVNVVVCKDSTLPPRFILCGSTAILDVHSVTIAVLDNTFPCVENFLLPAIEALSSPCKRSLKTDMRVDGAEVYSRCHGEEGCVVDSWVVPTEFLSFNQCGTRSVSNVLRFNYSCVSADPSTRPAVVLLPLPGPRRVDGTRVDIFSPYYPCYTPSGVYTVDCTISPKRNSGGYVFYKITPKYVRILPNSVYCGDHLYFDHGSQSGALSRAYCGATTDVEMWNDGEITDVTQYNLHLKYKVKAGGAGAKFWIVVEASGTSEITVTCAGQGDIPPMPSDSVCTPFVDTTVQITHSPTPTTPTTPTTSSTTPTTTTPTTTTPTTTTPTTTTPTTTTPTTTTPTTTTPTTTTPTTTTPTTTTPTTTTPTTTTPTTKKLTTTTPIASTEATLDEVTKNSQMNATETIDTNTANTGEVKSENTDSSSIGSSVLIGGFAGLAGVIIIVVVVAIVLGYKLRNSKKEKDVESKTESSEMTESQDYNGIPDYIAPSEDYQKLRKSGLEDEKKLSNIYNSLESINNEHNTENPKEDVDLDKDEEDYSDIYLELKNEQQEE